MFLWRGVRGMCYNSPTRTTRGCLLNTSPSPAACFTGGVPELDMAMLEVHDPSGRPEEAYFKSDGGGTELATIPALVSGCVLFQGCGPEPKIAGCKASPSTHLSNGRPMPRPSRVSPKQWPQAPC